MTLICKKGRSVIDYVMFIILSLTKIDNVKTIKDKKPKSSHHPIVVTLNIDMTLGETTMHNTSN
jgi:hypothetical protein